jgi:hypothetical protein
VRLIRCRPDFEDSAEGRLRDLCPETPPNIIGQIAHWHGKDTADEVASGLIRQRDSAKIVVGLRVLILEIAAEANVRFGTSERRIEKVVLGPAL